MNAWRRSAVRLGTLAILILGAGCGADSGEESTAGADYGEPVSGGTAVVAIGADMTIPLSIVAQGVVDGNLGGDVMYMELLRGAWEDGRLVYKTAEESPMALARSYELTGADSTSLRFHMRSDVNWSDGTPITASDVVYTYDLVGDPGLASPLQGVTEFLDSVEAEDDSTVVFHFTRRHPEMLTHSAIPILPSHTFGDSEPSQFRNHPAARNPENGNLPVSGAYMVGSWERGSRIVLVRNPEFEPAGYLDQIVYRVIPDAVTRQIELQTGGVDLTQTLTLDQVPMIREQAPNVRLELEEKRFYDFIGYNTQFEPFADREVRLALGMAIDRAGIIEALQMEEFAVIAGGPYPPIFSDLYDPEGQAPVPYDPEEATRILESMGWTDSDGDGVLDRDGVDLSFTLVTNTGNQRRADVSQIVQQQWAEIGVQAELRTVEFNTLNENLLRGDFQATLYGWSVGLSPDLTPYFLPTSPFNFGRYRDSEALDLMQSAREQPSYEASAPLWRAAASALVDGQPYTWLYFMDSVDGVNQRLRGTEINTYGAFQNVWEWWIPEELRR